MSELKPSEKVCDATFLGAVGDAVNDIDGALWIRLRPGISAVRALCLATPPRAEVDVEAVCKAVYPVWCATTPRESWSDMEFILRRALSRATGGA